MTLSPCQVALGKAMLFADKRANRHDSVYEGLSGLLYSATEALDNDQTQLAYSKVSSVSALVSELRRVRYPEIREFQVLVDTARDEVGKAMWQPLTAN